LFEPVVCDARDLLGLVRRCPGADRRQRDADDLFIIRERVDHLAPHVDVMDRWHLAHALADIRHLAVGQALKILLRKEMRVRVDAHEAVRSGQLGMRTLTTACFPPRTASRARRSAGASSAWVSTRSPWQPCARASSSNGGEGERSARNWPSSSPAAPSLNIESVARRTAP